MKRFAGYLLVAVALIAMLLASAYCATGQVKSPWDSAIEQAQHDNKPLVVMVGMPHCPACDRAEVYVPELRRRGVYVHLDLYRDAPIVKSLPSVPGYPSVIVWERRKDAWEAPKVYVGLPRIGVYIGGK